MSATLFSLLLLFVQEQPDWLEALVERRFAGITAQQQATVRVPGGRFRPLYASAGEQELSVAPFEIARDPVTNGQFLRFVRLYPNYRRGRISPLFADAGYLSHWAGATELGGHASAEQPVVHVSWFAAKAFCQSKGMRLPTELEWEYVASASETLPDARREPAFRERILSWYARPAADTLPPVGRSHANFYGVRDLHGVVWEWVLDWNSTLVSSDSRTGKSADRETFCGAGAVGSGDASDYASFMRSAFRSSLRAEYTTQSLGFRCGRDASGGAES